MCSSRYRQSVLKTSLPLSSATQSYGLETKSIMQLRQKIRGVGQVFALQENCSSNCSPFSRLFSLKYSPKLPNTITYYAIKTKSCIRPRQEIKDDNRVISTKKNYSPTLASLYRQSSLKYSPQLSNALRYYDCKTESTMQRWQGIMGENQVIAPEEHFWRVIVRRSHHSILGTLLPLSRALRFYRIRTETNIQL